MISSYRKLNGERGEVDLDTLQPLAKGKSRIKKGWSALLVFEPRKKIYIELRSSPPDIRGNSIGEEEEVGLSYAMKVFNVKPLD